MDGGGMMGPGGNMAPPGNNMVSTAMHSLFSSNNLLDPNSYYSFFLLFLRLFLFEEPLLIFLRCWQLANYRVILSY